MERVVGVPWRGLLELHGEVGLGNWWVPAWVVGVPGGSDESVAKVNFQIHK
jgi:hypothetical protein